MKYDKDYRQKYIDMNSYRLLHMEQMRITMITEKIETIKEIRRLKYIQKKIAKWIIALIILSASFIYLGI